MQQTTTAPRTRSAVSGWQTVLFVGATAVFVGYHSVWLAGPAAGLSFIGVEMGEWLKFLGLGVNRNLFYLPPITLGLTLALLAATWPNGRLQTWLLRGVAFLVSLLAFPALEDLAGGARSEYTPRLWLIGVVVLAIGLTAAWAWRQQRPLGAAAWLLMAVAAVFGAFLPTWLFMQVRPFVAAQVGSAIGIGLGVWLNGLGHLLIAVAAARQLRH